MLDKKKFPSIVISETQYKDILIKTYEGIIRKLNTANFLVENDKYISAGLFTYALEELGKLLLLKNINPENGKYTINYLNFTNHLYKFEIATDYLLQSKHIEYSALHRIDIIPKDSTGLHYNSFMLIKPANFESRLSVFYSDFEINEGNIKTVELPDIDKDVLKTAIQGFEKVISNYKI